MGDYGKRRMAWVVSQSQASMGWKDVPSFVARVAPPIAGAVIGYQVSGGELWARLASSAAYGIAGTLCTLGCIFAYFWFKAPAAMDAERQATITALETQLADATAASDATSGARYSGAQLKKFRSAISDMGAGVEILRDVSSVSIDPAYQQIVSIFKDAGWVVHDWISMDEPERPHGDITIYVGPAVWSNALNSILAGFDAAGVTVELRREEDSEMVMPRLIFSAAHS